MMHQKWGQIIEKIIFLLVEHLLSMCVALGLATSIMCGENAAKATPKLNEGVCAFLILGRWPIAELPQVGLQGMKWTSEQD